jgi:hypothetical protein
MQSSSKQYTDRRTNNNGLCAQHLSFLKHDEYLFSETSSTTHTKFSAGFVSFYTLVGAKMRAHATHTQRHRHNAHQTKE